MTELSSPPAIIPDHAGAFDNNRCGFSRMRDLASEVHDTESRREFLGRVRRRGVGRFP